MSKEIMKRYNHKRNMDAKNNELGNIEWYNHWFEIAKSIIIQSLRTSRMALIEGKWMLGEHIETHVKYFERAKIYGQNISEKIAQDIGISKREVDRCRQFYKHCIKEFKAKDWDTVSQSLPEEVGISWHKICNELLPAPKEKEEIVLPEGKYQIIYADPPWQYWEGGEKNQSRHYKTLTKDEIINYKDKNGRTISDLAAEDCIMFLWATFPALKESIEVLEGWGFEYSTVGFVWVKSKQDGTGFAFGNGSWTRANTEICLIGTKGIIERKDASISQIIYEPRGEHSEKPDIVREKIVELVGKLPRIELFGRKQVPGWTMMGDQV